MRLFALTPLLTCIAMHSTVVAATDAQAQRPLLASIERLFVSGHSLTDPPLPQHLSQIAASLGTPLQWNMQSIAGSSISMRIQGAGPEHAYRQLIGNALAEGDEQQASLLKQLRGRVRAGAPAGAKP